MSVKVPPMSTPICTGSSLAGPGYHSAMRDLLDRLDGWRDEQIEFLARLVNHDSGTDDVLDVNRVGAILVERLERLGFAVRRVVNDRFGDHLVGDKPGRAPSASSSSATTTPCSPRARPSSARSASTTRAAPGAPACTT